MTGGDAAGLPSNTAALALAVAVAACILLDARRDLNRLLTGRNVTLLSVAAWYLLEGILVPRKLAEYSQAAYDTGMLRVSLATAAFLAVYHAVNLPLFDDMGRRLAWLDRPRRIWPLMLGGLTIGLAPVLFLTGFDLTVFWEPFEALYRGQRRWSGSLGRARYGGLRDALLELQMFLRAVVPLAIVILTDRRATPGGRAFCGMFVLWMLLRAIAGGTRSQVIPVVLPLLAAVYWKSTPSRRRALVLLGVPLLALGGWYWSAFVVTNRNAGTRDFSKALDADYVGYEMFRELLWMNEHVPDRVGYQFGLTYYTQLVNPIPRFLWPGKPTADAGLLMAEAMGAVDDSGEAYLTNSPGFIGEAYLNFGLLGVLLLPAVAGVVVRAWDRLFGLCMRNFVAFAVYAAGLATIFLSGRSFNMSTFYGLLALYALLVLMQKAGWGGQDAPRAAGGRVGPPELPGGPVASSRRVRT